MRASAVRTRLQPNVFGFFFRFQYVTYFFLLSQPSSFTFLIKFHQCLLIVNFLFPFYFSSTVSIRIFITEMILSCYLSMLVILNLLNRFATFHT